MQNTKLNVKEDIVDLEFLRTSYPNKPEISPVDIANNPERVAGIQRNIQRYVNLLFTGTGTVGSAPDTGSEFANMVRIGSIPDLGTLTHEFMIANYKAMEILDSSDEDYIVDADGERIDTMTLVGIDVDTSTGTTTIELEARTADGSMTRVVLPSK